MDTLNDYLNATPAEQDAERAKRGWAPRPPIVHTHRKPGRVTSADVLASRRRLAGYEPTHRGEPRSVMEELRFNNTNAGRTHA